MWNILDDYEEYVVDSKDYYVADVTCWPEIITFVDRQVRSINCGCIFSVEYR